MLLGFEILDNLAPYFVCVDQSETTVSRGFLIYKITVTLSNKLMSIFFSFKISDLEVSSDCKCSHEIIHLPCVLFSTSLLKESNFSFILIFFSSFDLNSRFKEKESVLLISDDKNVIHLWWPFPISNEVGI